MQDRLYFRYVFQKKLDNGRIITSLKFYNIEDIEHPNFMDEINELSRKGYVLITRNFSTGLKDKNGKLIYEGDIVNLITEIEETAIIKWDNDIARFVIENSDILADFDNYNSSELEVIDNIYENPELLKEVQGE